MATRKEGPEHWRDYEARVGRERGHAVYRLHAAYRRMEARRHSRRDHGHAFGVRAFILHNDRTPSAVEPGRRGAQAHKRTLPRLGENRASRRPLHFAPP